jgi:hypothetical protein
MPGRWMLTAFFIVLFFAVYAKKNIGIGAVKCKVKINVKNVVGDAPLILNTGRYSNANNDSFSVTMFKYYISNIKFVSENGKEFREPNSYHLINEAKVGTKEFSINIPEGNYKQVSFTIGVDSLHNVSGAQDGDLDPLNAMFWDWNTGYIMLKMEGILLKDNAELAFHLGGFKGVYNVLRKVTITFPELLAAANGKNPEIFIKANLAELYKTPHVINFFQTPVITVEGGEAAKIADNYADMFSLDHTNQ